MPQGAGVGERSPGAGEALVVATAELEGAGRLELGLDRLDGRVPLRVLGQRELGPQRVQILAAGQRRQPQHLIGRVLHPVGVGLEQQLHRHRHRGPCLRQAGHARVELGRLGALGRAGAHALVGRRPALGVGIEALPRATGRVLGIDQPGVHERSPQPLASLVVPPPGHELLARLAGIGIDPHQPGPADAPQRQRGRDRQRHGAGPGASASQLAQPLAQLVHARVAAHRLGLEPLPISARRARGTASRAEPKSRSPWAFSWASSLIVRPWNGRRPTTTS